MKATACAPHLTLPQHGRVAHTTTHAIHGIVFNQSGCDSCTSLLKMASVALLKVP
jgi:hypothetical protein